MNDNRGNNGGPETPFTCCAAVGQTLCLYCNSCSHMLRFTAVPDAKFPVPRVRLTSLTAAQKLSKWRTHTISGGNLFLFPAEEEAVRRLRTWRTLWPLLYQHHRHISGMCGVGVYVYGYCVRVDSWCLCLHLKSHEFREVKMAIGRRAELPLSKAFLSLHSIVAFISDPSRSETSDRRLSSQTDRRQRSRKRRRGLWLCSLADCIKSPGRGGQEWDYDASIFHRHYLTHCSGVSSSRTHKKYVSIRRPTDNSCRPLP